jgi:hypothetical protein
MGVKGTNKIYSSQYKQMIWEYLEGGCSPKQVLDIMRGVNPSFKISIPTVYEFQTLMQKEMQTEAEQEELYTLGNTIDPKTAIKHDGILLDSIIALGLEDLKSRKMKLTLPVVLKAIEMKKEMIGVEYRGQTIWGLLDYQKQFDQLVDVLAKRCPTSVFEAIIEDLKELGWASTAKKMGSLNIDEEYADLEDEEDERYVNPFAIEDLGNPEGI